MKKKTDSFQIVVCKMQHELARFNHEREFASFLYEHNRKSTEEWRELIEEASSRVDSAISEANPERITAVVREAEEILAPLAKEAKRYIAYCVGHAHIDMNWMWSWPETVAITCDTFDTMLRLMDEFPAFCFTQSQASVYTIVEKYQPKMLKQIAARVKEGRWEVAASHWVENDKNMVSGEALCRHLLYTRRYMKKLFGLSPEDVRIDWSPDTFGHAETVPTYLARGGIRYMYLHRYGGEGDRPPSLFWWQAPDSSKVLVQNDARYGYNGVLTPEHILHRIRSAVTEDGVPAFMVVYGVGDHGGGPTRRDILMALDMNTWPIFPRIRFSTAREFFERIEKEAGAGLPVVKRELNFENAGCYTSQSLIKKANRYAEHRLIDAEAAAGLAWASLGLRYPHDKLEEGWRNTLFCHFHDILPGSGVHETRTYCHGLFQNTMALTSSVETQSLRLLAAQVDTGSAAGQEVPDVPPSCLATGQGAGVGFMSANGGISQAEQSIGQGNRPFMIFNPTAWEREELIEATVWERGSNWPGAHFQQRNFAVHTPDGKTIAAQKVNSGHYWGHEFATFAFPVKVQSLGYAVYTLLEGRTAKVEPGVRQMGRVHPCAYLSYEREPEGLENNFVRVEIDAVSGGIRSLVDKRTGLELISPRNPAPVLEYVTERPHGMSSWLIDHSSPVAPMDLRAIRRKRLGPYSASLEVQFRVRESDITLTYELRAGDPRLHMHINVVWFQRGNVETGVPVLRMAFPLSLENARARYEVPFGAIDRDFNRGQELPALRWAQVNGKAGKLDAGCLLLNDSKHGHSLDGNTLRLTLIRSSYEPDILPEIGQHEIHVALVPFVGKVPVADAIRQGAGFNRALRVIGTDIHKGTMPQSGSLIGVSPATVVLESVKKAEDSESLVLRFFDPTGKAAVARAEFDRDVLGKVGKATEVDLLERPVRKSSARVAGANSVSVKVPVRGMASVMVRLRR